MFLFLYFHLMVKANSSLKFHVGANPKQQVRVFSGVSREKKIH